MARQRENLESQGCQHDNQHGPQQVEFAEGDGNKTPQSPAAPDSAPKARVSARIRGGRHLPECSHKDQERPGHKQWNARHILLRE